MDNLTHSLFALTLAGTGLGRARRGATATLLLASNVPDIEVVTALAGDRVTYLAVHRGPSHGLGAIGLAVATAALVWVVNRMRRPRTGEAAGFPALLGLALVGVTGHVAMDFATSYGTRILSPLGAAWYGVDWMPIADLLLIAILIGGLVAARARPWQRARIAAIALALVAGEYALRAGLHAAAISRAVALERAEIGEPRDGRPPATVFRYLGPDRPADLPAALPTLGSPFRFRVILRTANGYEVRTLDLLSDAGTAASGPSLRFAHATGPIVERAAGTASARLFLNFSRFPAAEVIEHWNGERTVHWYDLRFAQRVFPHGRDARRQISPFGAWVRLAADGRIVAQGLGPG